MAQEQAARCTNLVLMARKKINVAIMKDMKPAQLSKCPVVPGLEVPEQSLHGFLNSEFPVAATFQNSIPLKSTH
jgi:hypothetical protein